MYTCAPAARTSAMWRQSMQIKWSRAIEAVAGKQRKDSGEEGRELIACSSRRQPIANSRWLNCAQAADVPRDGDIVRSIDESHRGLFAPA